jgi:CRISPR type I-E-associated protein CasB/Cse2
VDYNRVGLAANVFWYKLQPDLNRRYPGNPGLLASLRRATTPFDAVCQEVVDLCNGFNGNQNDLEKAAVVAIVLASVKTHSNRKLAQLLSDTSGGRKLVSDSAFKTFCNASEPTDIIQQFRRLLVRTGYTANVTDLAESVVAWLTGYNTRKTAWCYDYYKMPLLQNVPELSNSME